MVISVEENSNNKNKKKNIIKKYNASSHFYDKRYKKIQKEKYEILLKNYQAHGKLILDLGCGTGLSFEWHCWQLVDVGTGNVLWTETDLARHLFLLEDEDELNSLGAMDVTFAPNSKAIAIHTTYMLPLARIIVIDLQTFQPTVINEYERFEHIYWGE